MPDEKEYIPWLFSVFIESLWSNRRFRLPGFGSELGLLGGRQRLDMVKLHDFGDFLANFLGPIFLPQLVVDHG